MESAAALDDDSLIENLMNAVRDPEAAMARVDAAMAAVRRRRQAYISASNQFDAHGASAYLRAWVANYELSELLLDFATSTSARGRRRLLFLRMNQYPMLVDATHEEHARIAVEEARFGGMRTGAGVITYSKGDAYFCVERFTRGRVSPRQHRRRHRCASVRRTYVFSHASSCTLNDCCVAISQLMRSRRHRL